MAWGGGGGSIIALPMVGNKFVYHFRASAGSQILRTPDLNTINADLFRLVFV